MKREKKRIKEQEPVIEKVNVKLQTNIEPTSKEGDIEEGEFIENLPVKVKEHFKSVINDQLVKLISDIQRDESQIVESIVELKVSYNFYSIERNRKS